MSKEQEQPEMVIIKKYANRRLYDTETSSYITLEDLCTRVQEGQDFIVVDAKSGQDLTRQVLTQIIFEQETKGSQILPTDFLRSVIRNYDGRMHEVLQHYLDASMKAFTSNQERVKTVFEEAMGGFKPFALDSDKNPLEEMTRQNMALFEQTMTSMFNPLGMFATEDSTEKDEPKKKSGS